MPRELTSLVNFILTEGLLFVVAVFLTVKGLMFERKSELGRAMAYNNLAMALVHYAALVAVWMTVTRHPAVFISLRVLVVATTYHALRAFAQAYGGWRGVARELQDSAGEGMQELWHAACAWRRHTPLPVKLAQLLVILGIVALILGARGWPPFAE